MNNKIKGLNVFNLDIDEIINADYTYDNRDLIITDETVNEILNEPSNVHNIQSLINAFEFLRADNIVEFRNIIGENKTLLNTKYNNTYLIHESCKLKNPECVSLLLFLGADCSLIDDYGFTAQHHAVMSGSTLIIDILSLFGISMDVVDINGNHPFHYAFIAQDDEMLKTLMTYSELHFGS